MSPLSLGQPVRSNTKICAWIKHIDLHKTVADQCITTVALARLLQPNVKHKPLRWQTSEEQTTVLTSHLQTAQTLINANILLNASFHFSLNRNRVKYSTTGTARIKFTLTVNKQMHTQLQTMCVCSLIMGRDETECLGAAAANGPIVRPAPDDGLTNTTQW